MKKVKNLWLYRSNLVRIPPEIGEMESLEDFDPYTSYNLRWFPYEITHCKNLKDSRVSTRAIFGNFKNRMPFPSLHHNPVRYFGNTVKCSVCKKEMSYTETNQLWISLWVGTDTLPLLANLCSKECETKLPTPSKKYVQFPHKGGLDLIQPQNDGYRHWTEEYSDNIFDLVGELHQCQEKIKNDKNKERAAKASISLYSSLIQKLPLLKLIKKIWEK